jgi:hypothetical protein
MPKSRFPGYLSLPLAVMAASLSSTAMAGTEPSTRLVDCRAGSCLLISGERDHAASVVRINGQAVAVDGRRKWRVRVPVETVRRWSEPFARTISVATVDPRTQRESVAEADLPIGLLGNVTNLASLVVRVK